MMASENLQSVSGGLPSLDHSATNSDEQAVSTLDMDAGERIPQTTGLSSLMEDLGLVNVTSAAWRRPSRAEAS